MIKSILTLTLILLTISAHGTVAPLDGVVRPAIFIVKADRIYTLEGATVSIFSLKDQKLIKRFGKAGEGPGELRYNANFGRPLSMAFEGDNLVVNSLNRMSYFSMDGAYLREQNMPIDMLLFRTRQKYVGVGPIQDEKSQNVYLGFRFYSHSYQPLALIHRCDIEIENMRKLIIPVDSFAYNPVYKDLIYINTSADEFIIDVFNEEGTKVRTIRKDYPQIPLGEDHRRATHEFFKTNPRYKSQYEVIGKALTFRDKFPPIRDLHLAEDRIHVITYKRQGELWEMIVLDLQGQELGRTFIPLSTFEPFSFYPILYSVSGRTVYTLVEDENEEGWVVKATPLNLK